MTVGADVDSDSIGSAVIIPSGSVAVNLAKAEIDQQIATAKQYPRTLQRVTANILTLATLDDEAAKECMYSLPRGGKPIVGPSIRLAEIVASQWGNCRIAARPTDVDRDNKRVEAQGLFWDLQTNVGQMVTVHRRIVDKHGKLYNDDMILVTANAACSIARRNAILAGVPKAVWRKAYDAAVAVIKGDIKTLSERKEKAYQAFAAFGIKREQLFSSLGIGGDEDVTMDHLPVLIGMHQALKNGESTVEEMFPAKKAASFSTTENPLAGDAEEANGAADMVDQTTGEVTSEPHDGAPADDQKSDIAKKHAAPQRSDPERGQGDTTTATEQSAATSAPSPDVARGAADQSPQKGSAAPNLFGKGRK